MKKKILSADQSRQCQIKTNVDVMMEAETVSQTLVFNSPLMRMIARENFTANSNSKSTFNTRCTIQMQPNVADERLTLLFCILEDMGANPVPETGYPEAFCSCPQLFQANSGLVT
jgi:hypothetical protein